MDDVALGRDFLTVLAAIAGVLVASDRTGVTLPGERAAKWPEDAERERRGQQPGKLVVLGIIAVLAFFETRSWYGMLMSVLMPVGAYKMAAMVAEPLWRRRRQRQRLATLALMDQTGSKPAS